MCHCVAQFGASDVRRIGIWASLLKVMFAVAPILTLLVSIPSDNTEQKLLKRCHKLSASRLTWYEASCRPEIGV